jgi:hypothetical protein
MKKESTELDETEGRSPRAKRFNINREFRDSLFRRLFIDDERALREIAAAVTGINYPPDTPVKVEILGDVLLNGIRNDLAFTIGGVTLMMIEHQSTFTFNITVRLFDYTADVFKRILDMRRLFKKKRVLIPRPVFIVFYNGPDPLPGDDQDKCELRLSDSFAKVPGDRELPSMELVVWVFNIRLGHNEALMSVCEKLRGYAVLVDKVERYLKEEATSRAAAKRAVRECLSEGILTEFLNENAREVISMLASEWDWDAVMDVIREEAEEDGEERGKERWLAMGKADEKEQLARRLLGSQLSLQEIAEFSELPLSRIQDLARQLHSA